MKKYLVGLLVIAGLIVIGGLMAGCGLLEETARTTTTTTTTIPDVSSPVVVSVIPADGATGVPTNSQIKATFSKDMDAATINTDTFKVSGSIVTGSVSYDAGARTAIFNPTSGLEEYRTYTATIAAGVKDTSGNELGTAYSWGFRSADETAPVAGSLSINSGAATTESRSVTVSLAATDEVGVVGYYLSESSAPPSAGSAGWVSIASATNYSADVSFDLSSCGGTKEVHAWFKDAAGNISSSASDAIYSAYAAIWRAAFDSGTADYAQDVVVDSFGNVYVTGYRYRSMSNHDYLTVKFDPAGTVVWLATYESGSDDKAFGIALDNSENIYVTGYANNDYYTIKYDSNGNELSSKSYDRGWSDQANGVAVDASGNIFVTGRTWNGSNSDYTTIKYDPGWNVVWIATHESGRSEIAEDIAVGSSGNVCVTGYRDNGTHQEYYTIVYDSNGGKLWDAVYDSGVDDDNAYGIAVDASGNVSVTGYAGNGTDADYYTIKYDPSGNEVWARAHDSGNNDYGYDIALDSSGNVYVTGSSDFDYYTIKYDSNGNKIWGLRYDSGVADEGWGITIDEAGNVYITGYPTTNNDYYTIKYGQD